MTKLLIIAVAGGVGSVLRYLIAGWVQRLSGGTFPVGTLSVNVVGCLTIAFLGAYFFGPRLIREEYRLALLVGLLGGFTTFSTFAWESLSLMNDGQFRMVALNLLLSNGLGLAAAWVGYRLGISLFGV